MQQCCSTVLFYSGRQLPLRCLNRESCSSRQFPPTLKSVRTAHHPLNGTHSCLCTNAHAKSRWRTQVPLKHFLSFHISCIYANKTVWTCAKVHLAHTLTASITVRSLRKNLSISPKTDDSIYNIPPIKSWAYASPLPLFTTPHESSKSFYWQTTPWRPWRFLNAVRKGHDIQKWHSLWGNGLDVWPLNKVSSIGSISEPFGVLCIAREWLALH